MPPPRRHLGPGVGPQPGHLTISRSSSSLSDRSAVADGRREPLPSPAAMPAPAVQAQRASCQQATPPAQRSSSSSSSSQGQQHSRSHQHPRLWPQRSSQLPCRQ